MFMAVRQLSAAIETIHASYWKTASRAAISDYHRRGSPRVTLRANSGRISLNGGCKLSSKEITEETIPMKLTWYGHSAFGIEVGAAKILIDPFLSDNPSWKRGWEEPAEGVTHVLLTTITSATRSPS
jgi:Beta-lactamase superfamily domain